MTRNIGTRPKNSKMRTSRFSATYRKPCPMLWSIERFDGVGHRRPIDPHHARKGQRIETGIDRVRNVYARGPDEEAAHSRPHDPGHVDRGHAQRHGVRQPAPADHVGDDGIPRRHDEGEDRPYHRHLDQDVPVIQLPAQKQGEHDHLSHHHRCLPGGHQAPAFEPVGRSSSDRPQTEHRECHHQADEPQCELAAGEGVDEPRTDDQLGPAWPGRRSCSTGRASGTAEFGVTPTCRRGRGAVLWPGWGIVGRSSGGRQPRRRVSRSTLTWPNRCYTPASSALRPAVSPGHADVAQWQSS